MSSRSTEIPEQYITNRFINYYVIKYIWLQKRKETVKKLFLLLFPSPTSKKGNKTLYDRILRCDNFDLGKKVVGLYEKTGLSKDYFLGKKAFQIEGLNESDWKNFIKMRKARKGNGHKTSEFARCEIEINKKLNETIEDSQKQDGAIETIIYYISHERKESENQCGNRIAQVSTSIQQFTRLELENIERSELENYYKLLSQHCLNIAAILRLMNFK